VYLFLVDYSNIASKHLQKMFGQVLPEEDIVNCFSPSTLLKISEKFNPDLVIIDFTMVEADKVDLIETLRDKCPDTYILAMIETDYYDQLYQAIEKNLIDDYIVKPVSEDEFAARILITTRRKIFQQPLFDKPLPQQPVDSNEQEVTTANIKEPDEFDFLEATPAPTLFEVSEEIKSTESEGDSVPRLEEEYYLNADDEELEEVSFSEADLQLPKQESPDLETVDRDDGLENKDDLFIDQFALLEADEPTRSLLEEELPGTTKSEKELGEDYFDDLFPEQHDAEEKTEKNLEPELLPPAPPVFKGLDDEPERDIDISIKDFMPGESADQFLKEHENEVETGFDEDLLDRFLGDEEEDEPDEEDDYEEDNEPSGLSRFLAVFVNIVLVLLLLMMASLSFFLIHNRVADGPPSLAGFTFYVMQDDDLNADANPGSLAVVRATDVTAISQGDIINFRSPVNPSATSTQRVVEINRDGGLKFVTSGDGAGAIQTTLVPAENVSGRVLFSVPFYGRMVDYVQTSQGLILLIFLPGVIIIIFQLIKIIRHLSGNRKSGRRGRYREVVEEE
jgi:signal peptidase I